MDLELANFNNQYKKKLKKLLVCNTQNKNHIINPIDKVPINSLSLIIKNKTMSSKDNFGPSSQINDRVFSQINDRVFSQVDGRVYSQVDGRVYSQYEHRNFPLSSTTMGFLLRSIVVCNRQK